MSCNKTSRRATLSTIALLIGWVCVVAGTAWSNKLDQFSHLALPSTSDDAQLESELSELDLDDTEEESGDISSLKPENEGSITTPSHKLSVNLAQEDEGPDQAFDSKGEQSLHDLYSIL